jgi:hypothetical protein
MFNTDYAKKVKETAIFHAGGDYNEFGADFDYVANAKYRSGGFSGYQLVYSIAYVNEYGRLATGIDVISHLYNRGGKGNRIENFAQGEWHYRLAWPKE